MDLRRHREADLLDAAKARGADIPLPTDVVVAPELRRRRAGDVKRVDDVGADDMILDIGPETAQRYAELIAQRRHGRLERPGRRVRVRRVRQRHRNARARRSPRREAFSIAGGGDTLAAIDKYGVADKISYISTGGGAFLEFLEGKKLPAVAALEQRARGAKS